VGAEAAGGIDGVETCPAGGIGEPRSKGIGECGHGWRRRPGCGARAGAQLFQRGEHAGGACGIGVPCEPIGARATAMEFQTQIARTERAEQAAGAGTGVPWGVGGRRRGHRAKTCGSEAEVAEYLKIGLFQSHPRMRLSVRSPERFSR